MDGEHGRSEEVVLKLLLELRLDQQPISGRLRTERGADEPFVGWLGFLDSPMRLQEQGDASANSSGDPPAS
jgi:hypothetical protein